jgi:hypothetical protein
MKVLQMGHMNKTNNATQGKSTNKQRTQAMLKTHVMPTTLQATDKEMFLVCIGVVAPITIFSKVFLQVWPS